MAGLSNEQRKLLERATLRYHDHLDEAAEVLAARGLDLDHARSSVLGVVRNPIPGHEHLEGRLAIPYVTDAGPVNMNFRCLKDHDCKTVPDHVKYMMWKGLKSNLYNVQSFAHADEWIGVTEGEIDCLTLTQIGIPSVAIGGAKKWVPHWTNVFEDFSRVYVFTDGDSAGKEFGERVSDNVQNVIRVRMDPGEDVNSTFVKQGAEAILKRIKK
jgi:hypothetical protein